MSIISSQIYHCPHCSQHYKRKVCYDTHVVRCKIMRSVKKDRDIYSLEDDDIPTVRELCTFVQDLAKKYVTVQEELSSLKRWVNNKRKKLNIVSNVKICHVKT